MKRIRRAGLLACLGILGLVLASSLSDAAIIGGSGTGDITFHSDYYPDISITPSNTTGTLPIPRPGALTHEVWAPGGLEHAYMGMSWDYSASKTNVFIPGPLSPPLDTTRLELAPAPTAAPALHSATMTGSFNVLYTLDGAGLPTTTIPGQTYQVLSYINPAVGSPSAASFDAHWDYTDTMGGFLGSQDIHHVPLPGFGVMSTVSSLPLTLTVPAGHTTLKVSGYFKLSATSDYFPDGPPYPYDTLIGVAPIPEPSTFVLLGVGALGLLTYAWGRKRQGL